MAEDMRLGELMALQRLALAINGALGDRALLAGRLGLQYGGDRDIYAAAGYPREIRFEDYMARYRRGDIAQTIVNAEPDATWTNPPELRDGADPATASRDTDFVRVWSDLATAGEDTGQLELEDSGIKERGLLYYLQKLDRLSGVGRFGALLMGISDGSASLTDPLVKMGASSPDDLLYCQIFTEGRISVETMDVDKQSPRYGLPLIYSLTTDGGTISGSGAATQTIRAHWTRVIHVAEGAGETDTVGTPRLESVWNRLVDLEKITAATGESAWRLMDSGNIISTKQDQRLPTDPDDLAELEDQIDEFVHGLRRWLLAEGLEAQRLEGQISDPSGLVSMNLDFIAATTRIPKRILLGSERGELSSNQDERNWAIHIQTRRVSHAIPAILRPTITRLIYAGVIPAPASGSFSVWWPSILQPSRAELADIAQKSADSLQKMGITVEPAAFVEAYLPDLEPSSVSYASPISPAPAPQPATNREEGTVEPSAVHSFRISDLWGVYP